MVLAEVVGDQDDQGRLRCEHDQDFFVCAGELPSSLLLGQIDVADVLVAETDGRTQKGLHRPQRRADLGQAGRPGMAGEIGQPQRFGKHAQVLEELQSPGQVDEALALLCGQAGGDEFRRLPGVVEDSDSADARAGQRTGAVDNPLQDGIEVEVGGDLDAGLAQSGEAVAQNLILM